MKITFSMIVIVCSIAFAGTPQPPSDQVFKLWGKQTAGMGYEIIANKEGNKIHLMQTAEIMKVEGDAVSYCIWTIGRAVLCGGEEETLVGKTLKPGKYCVVPGLDGKETAQITVYLKYIELPSG